MAIDGKFDRAYVRRRAARLYDQYRVAHRYEYIMRCILDIHNGTNGWYSPNCHLHAMESYYDAEVTDSQIDDKLP